MFHRISLQYMYSICSFVHSSSVEIAGRKRHTTAAGCIKATDGSILTDPESIRKRWTEYITLLFEDERGELPSIDDLNSGPPITKEETQRALQAMKHGKAVGPDEVPTELLQALEDHGIDVLHNLFNNNLGIYQRTCLNQSL